MGSFLTNDLVDAYLELCLGAAALRLPNIEAVLQPYPTFGIKSSYSEDHTDPIIRVGLVLRDIKEQGLLGSKGLRNSFTQINRMFLIAMWDMLLTTTKYQGISNDPLIQFFRHIRNGCAHGNLFNITAPLQRPASWRDKTIVNPLHRTPVIPDFLADGDALLLVRDVDAQYFTP